MDFLRELGAEGAPHRREQGLADAVEMVLLDSVTGVSLAESRDGREQAVRIVEGGDDDRERLRELLSLRTHVHVGEQFRGALVDLEQTRVECRRERVSLRGECGPRRTNECYLVGIHDWSHVKVSGGALWPDVLPPKNGTSRLSSRRRRTHRRARLRHPA